MRRCRASRSRADYSADHRTAAEKEIIESLVPTLERVKRMTLAYGEQARAGSLRNVEAGTFNREMYGAFDPLGTALSTLIDLQLSEGAKLNEQMEKRYDSMRTTFLLIGAAAWSSSSPRPGSSACRSCARFPICAG